MLVLWRRSFKVWKLHATLVVWLSLVPLCNRRAGSRLLGSPPAGLEGAATNAAKLATGLNVEGLRESTLYILPLGPGASTPTPASRPSITDGTMVATHSLSKGARG
jgi:hypothetical protein